MSAAAALLVLSGALALPATAEAQSLRGDDLPVLEFTKSTVAIEDAGHANVFLKLDRAASVPVKVHWETSEFSPATAVAGVDYWPGPGTVTFAPGDVEEQFRVMLRNDDRVEDTEKFLVIIRPANPALVTVPEYEREYTIIDTDDLKLTIDVETVVREAARVAHVRVYAEEVPLDFDFNFQYETQPGTVVPEGLQGNNAYTAYVAEAAGLTYAAATEGRDYRHTTGTLTFGPGRLRHTITVPIINDGAQEEPELFQIWMQRVKETDRRIRGPGRAARVVIDRSDYPLVSLWDAEGVEGEDMVFTVALSKATGADVTVDWTVDFWRGSTADAADFETMSGTATVAAGSREATFTVATADDAADEEDETFLVTLSNFSWNSQIGDPTATGVITDNDVSPFEPSVVRNVTVLNGPGPDGVWSAGERVELEVRYSLPVVVRQPRYWVDADGARHPPGPFVTVAFRSGPGYGQSLGVALVPYVSGSGTDRLRFDYQVGADEAGARRVVVAHDAMVLRGATIRTFEGGEGASRYTNTRVMQTTVRKPDGAAWTGGDTVRVAVRFAGPVSYTPPDEPLNRDKVVVDETGGTPTIGLRLGDRERRTLAHTARYERGSGSDTLTFEYEVRGGDGRVSAVEVEADSLARNGATIRNEDGYDAELNHVGALWYSPLALRVRDAAAREGGTLKFAMELARASQSPVTVDYETADGTATAGEDYTAKRGTVTFAPGRTRRTVEVPVLRDEEAEDAETVVLRLSNARSAGSEAPVEVTVARAEGTIEDVAPEAPSGGLTARFARAPSEHDGSSPFKVRVGFSEAVRMSGRRLRADVVAVAGGRTTKARPVNGRKDLWELTVKPGSNGDVVLTLAGGAACDSPGAVCTPDGRALANTISTVVRGPVAVSVADARAREGEDETIDFRVSLSRAASRTVTVTYATADRTARAGEDYTRTSGKLGFAPGETERTVRVPVLDDAVDEGEETLALRLTNASGAQIADGEATGTIVNSDPLQKMWLSRFGRTVAGQVVEAVSERLARPLTGAQVTLAGRSVDLARANEEAELASAAAGLARALGAGDAPEPDEGAGGRAQSQPRPGLSGVGRRIHAQRLGLRASARQHVPSGDAARGRGSKLRGVGPGDDGRLRW